MRRNRCAVPGGGQSYRLCDRYWPTIKVVLHLRLAKLHPLSPGAVPSAQASVYDDAIDLVAFGGARAHKCQSARREPFGIDLAVDEPTRSGKADAPEPMLDGLCGDDLGDVQPAQRGSRFNARKRLVNGVIRADQEIGADLRELVCGGESQLAHALPAIAVEALHVLGERVRVHQDLGMSVRR